METKPKPFSISKQAVWEAWLRVKANRGAAGVDGESIADFECGLKNNLYRIWNRMSSGSYFPPPVRTVMIPKASGGERPLGIPTVGDRVAQTVAKPGASTPDVGPTLTRRAVPGTVGGAALPPGFVRVQAPGASSPDVGPALTRRGGNPLFKRSASRASGAGRTRQRPTLVRR